MERVLLLYITNHSGHHRATLAIEQALRSSVPDVSVRNINCFNYTNPVLERFTNNLYNKVIKIKPEVWEYMYDNQKMFRRTRKLRKFIHKFNSKKLKKLIFDFRPDIIACTQAFPCGMVADFKKTFKLDVPLVGVLTDYYPHSYWVYDNIDAYVVPSLASKEKLVSAGIPDERVRVFGIPIDPIFGEPAQADAAREDLKLDSGVPTVLLMGGGQGLGPLQDLVFAMNTIAEPVQLIVVCGSNQKLRNWLEKRRRLFRKKMAVFGYVRNIHHLMDASDLIVTKPGGLTTAESLAKHLPIVIVNPIPGQEAKNTEFLLREGVAVKAKNPLDAAMLIEELLMAPGKLRKMRVAAGRQAQPQSAENAAQLLRELVCRKTA